jgi:hypothetical protein
MIKKPDSYNRYHSAQDRFLKASLGNFFAREFPKLFGPIMREKLAHELLALVNSLYPETIRLQPGQILWNALDQNTRATSARRNYLPVILTVITSNDIEQLAQGVSMPQIAAQAIARMFREAYDQGAILSTRDVGLLTLKDPSIVSDIRIAYEKNTIACCLIPACYMIWVPGFLIKRLLSVKSLSKKRTLLMSPGKPIIPRKRLIAISMITIELKPPMTIIPISIMFIW